MIFGFLIWNLLGSCTDDRLFFITDVETKPYNYARQHIDLSWECKYPAIMVMISHHLARIPATRPTWQWSSSTRALSTASVLRSTSSTRTRRRHQSRRRRRRWRPRCSPEYWSARCRTKWWSLSRLTTSCHRTCRRRRPHRARRGWLFSARRTGWPNEALIVPRAKYSLITFHMRHASLVILVNIFSC